MSFICETCARQFSRNFTLKRHQKDVHSTSAPVSTPAVKWNCTLCEYEGSPKNIETHYENDHKLLLEKEVLHFVSENSFNDWKHQIEKQTVCKYLLVRGEKNGVRRYFYHRSGKFVSKGQGTRHIKTQGSKKIEGYCPARIIVRTNEENRKYPIEVEFWSAHVGHNNELCHITLSPNTKQKIASKLLNKIPSDAIIDEVRNTIVSDELEWIHLLTNTDIYNISKEFGITAEFQKDKNDAISVHTFVTELRESKGGSSVLYYKPQDSIDETYPMLKPEDFILVLMNKPQTEMLIRYRNYVISIDGTHGMSYDFQLHTLLVLDKVHEGFPCSFLVSNREDEEVITIFFNVIKAFCGKITPKVFMLDMATQFSNAWNAVMGEPKFQLYCTWHVDNVWQKNLNKIKTDDGDNNKRTFVYKLLGTLLEERDQDRFHILLSEAVNTLISDKDTIAFGEYFRSYYANNYQKWAYCYRLHAGLNTNNHLERMHGTLKYIYLKGREVGHLDKSLFFLMKFIRNKLFSQVILQEKGKISYKLRCLRKRHLKSKGMHHLATETTSDNGEKKYLVTASSGKCIYEVTRNIDNVHSSCKLLCDKCANTCIHQYVCTCVDNVIKYNMCKHIHHVIQNCLNPCSNVPRPLDLSNNLQSNEELADIDDNNNSLNKAIISELKVEESLKEADQYYAKGKSFCTDNSSRQFFIKEMKRVALKMECGEFKAFSPTKCSKRAAELKQSRDIRNSKPSKGITLTPQKRLYSTKKKRTASSKNKHQAPSAEAKDGISCSLICS